MTTLEELNQRARILERDANTRADAIAEFRVEVNQRFDAVEQRLGALERLETDVRRILQILEGDRS